MSPLTQMLLEHNRLRWWDVAALPFPEKMKIVEQMNETATRTRSSAALARRKRDIHPKS